MKFSAFLLLIQLFFAGCVTSPQTPLPTSMIYSVPKNVIWPLLVQQIGLDYPVKTVEKDSGLITTDFVTIPCGYGNSDMGRWATAPSVFLGTWDGFRMSLNAIAVEPEPGKTQITIRAHYEAYESNVSKSWMACVSNGSLENEMLSKIESQVQHLIGVSPSLNVAP